MRAFWDAGYEGTSTQDLCVATGLGRSSIYNTFESKRDLYERALRRYMDDKNARTFAILDGPGSVKDRIRSLLWSAVEPPDDEPLGCLVVNATVEMGQRDSEVSRLLAEDRQRRLAALASVFEVGQAAGEIDRSKSAVDLANFVISTISGLRVVARGGADRQTLQAIAEVALSSL